MEKILSREEIEELVNLVAQGRIDPARELARQGGVANYDFSGMEYRSYSLPNLDLIYDGFIRFNRVTMSNRLRRIVEIKKVVAKSYKFDDFLPTLPSPVCMAIYKIEPLKGAALVAMDSSLVFSVVDSVLGGSGQPIVTAENRLFTSIELRLMEKIVKDLLLDMEKAWAPLYATRMNLLRMEMNPRLVNIVPSEYQVVATTLRFQIDDLVGDMVFAIPYMTIEPIREKLRSGLPFDSMAVDPMWSCRLSDEICEAPMDIRVELGRSNINLGELLDLQKGDTIMLDKYSQGEMSVLVGGVEKFVGVPGIRHGSKAVQITKSA